MALPVQTSPVYKLTIPSTKKKITFRPFLVKEEKALLLAEQSEEISFMVETLKKIIADCTFNKVDVESLAVFDLEYILTKLRAKSIGEIADVNVICEKCKKPNSLKVDISNLEVTRFPDHTNKIALFDSVGVVMSYPKIDILNDLSKNSSETDNVFNAAIECIDYIYDAEMIYHSKDQTKEELNKFIDNLNREQFSKIEKFFETMPILEVPVEYKCVHCEHINKKKIEGIQNFF